MKIIRNLQGYGGITYLWARAHSIPDALRSRVVSMLQSIVTIGQFNSSEYTMDMGSDVQVCNIGINLRYRLQHIHTEWLG